MKTKTLPIVFLYAVLFFYFSIFGNRIVAGLSDISAACTPKTCEYLGAECGTALMAVVKP